MIKTTLLETSKLLREAGLRKDTECYWIINPRPKKYFSDTEIDGYLIYKPIVTSLPINSISAFTTDEILEELPDFLNGEALMYWKKLWRGEMLYFAEISLINRRKESKTFEGKSLPEALAAMWLYLKNQGLLEKKG